MYIIIYIIIYYNKKIYYINVYIYTVSERVWDPSSNTFSSGNSGGVVGDGGGLEDLCELWKKSAGDFCPMVFCKHITLKPGGIGNW